VHLITRSRSAPSCRACHPERRRDCLRLRLAEAMVSRTNLARHLTEHTGLVGRREQVVGAMGGDGGSAGGPSGREGSGKEFNHIEYQLLLTWPIIAYIPWHTRLLSGVHWISYCIVAARRAHRFATR